MQHSVSSISLPIVTCLDQMAYPSFSCSQKLISLKITKELLVALEQYFLKWVTDAAIVPKEEAPKSLSIEIEDKHGTEKITSVSQFTASRFPDGTSTINMVLRKPFARDDMNFSVNLSFSREPSSSILRIDATMPNAREVVLGFKDGILRMLEQQKTWHWIAHPTPKIGLTLISLVLIISIFLEKKDVSPLLSFFLLGALALIAVYLFGGIGVLRRYTEFDSRASERSDKIWSWLIGGLATFLFFGTLLTFFRHYLLGF